jgi:hypothetical protein
MSLRSRDSYAQDKRMSRHRLTDEDVFKCVHFSREILLLLTAFLMPAMFYVSRESPPFTYSADLTHFMRRSVLAHIMSAKAPETVAAPAEVKDKDYVGRVSGVLSSSVNHVISLGDLFKDSSSKSVKFPEKLVKVLEAKLQGIAMGKDPVCVRITVVCRASTHALRCRYSDQLTRRTMAVFYGQLTQDAFRRQVKENRKVEELILMFATHATGVLRKEPTLAGDLWKPALNEQIAVFVRMLQECMRGLHASSELLARLDQYSEKLAPPSPSVRDSGYDSPSASARDSVYSLPGQPLSAGPSLNVAEMPLVLTLADLFQMTHAQVQQEVDKLRRTCNEKVSSPVPLTLSVLS